MPQESISNRSDAVPFEGCESQIRSKVSKPIDAVKVISISTEQHADNRKQVVMSTRRQRIRGGPTQQHVVVGNNGASFLDLPREVRDQIYYYAIASHDKVWNIGKPRGSKEPNDHNLGRNISERYPQLCPAMPLYTKEVLETHYKHNILRFGRYYGEGPPALLNWIHQRGIDLVKNVRHVRLVHQFSVPGLLNNRGYMVTFINQLPGRTLEATSNQLRTDTDCHCGIAELVQERLLRDDAQQDIDCVRRIEESAEYGPVLGFALQLLEAVRLALKHESWFHNRTYQEKLQIYNQLPGTCVLCGKPKWALRY